MEHFPKADPEKHFDDRFKNLVQKAIGEMQTLEQREVGKEEEWVKNIRLLEKNFPLALDTESISYLESLSDSDFEMTIALTLRYFTGNKNRSLEKLPKLGVDNLKNFLMYGKVFGYEHQDVRKRELENPMPTAQELLLGCYNEQIEEQTRKALLTLRAKGYGTIQSGFCDKYTGSQFFHLDDKSQAIVPEELIHDLQEKFHAAVSINNDQIEIIPSAHKTIEEWNDCLNYFAEHMPTVGEEKYSTVGGSIYFIFDAIKKYPLSEILKTAQNEHEKDLVEKLYRCNTEKELASLIGVELYDEEDL